MLLVAQRVRPSGGGNTAINTYRYTHVDDHWPDEPLTALHTAVRRVQHAEELVAGGNRVVSYVDLAVPPDAQIPEVLEFLQHVAAVAQRSADIVAWGRMALKYEVADYPDWRSELALLLTRALA